MMKLNQDELNLNLSEYEAARERDEEKVAQTPRTQATMVAAASASAPPSPKSTSMEGLSPLPADFCPSNYSVILGRGKGNYLKVGNRRCRIIVRNMLAEFTALKTQKDRAAVVDKVLNIIKEACPIGGFVKNVGGTWYEVDDKAAKMKINQMFRDVRDSAARRTTSNNSSSSSSWKETFGRNSLRRNSTQSMAMSLSSQSSLSSNQMPTTFNVLQARNATGAEQTKSQRATSIQSIAMSLSSNNTMDQHVPMETLRLPTTLDVLQGRAKEETEDHAMSQEGTFGEQSLREFDFAPDGFKPVELKDDEDSLGSSATCGSFYDIDDTSRRHSI